jgi:hypothetical protein
MNDEPPVLPTPSPKPSEVLPIGGGMLVGTAVWLLTLLPLKNYGAIPFLLFACFALPVIGIILGIIKSTRLFGLGLLLACGLGWLVLGAICGGVLRF